MTGPAKAFPYLTDEQYEFVVGAHEIAHSLTAMAYGIVPTGLWITPDRSVPDSGQASIYAPPWVPPQHIVTVLAAGPVMETLALGMVGYNPVDHPFTVEQTYGAHAVTDAEEIRRVRMKVPHAFIDEDRASADAEMLVHNDRLLNANLDLTAVLRQQEPRLVPRSPERPDDLVLARYLSPEQIKALAAPHNVESAIDDQLIPVWSPQELAAEPGAPAPAQDRSVRRDASSRLTQRDFGHQRPGGTAR